MNRILLFSFLLSLFACQHSKKGTPDSASDLLDAFHTEESAALPPYDSSISYTGKVDSYPVEMTLHFMGDSITGSYRYLSQDQSKSLRLEGKIVDQDQQMVLKEYSADGQHTGTFRAYAGYRSKFVGDWAPASNQSSVQFSLKSKEQLVFIGTEARKTGKLLVESKRLEINDADSTIHLSFLYPKFTDLEDEEVQNRINQYFAPPEGEALDAMMDNYDMGMAGEPDAMSSSYEKSFQINGVTDRLLSITESEYEYMAGAAHGNYGSETLNFDLETGLLFENSDLFVPGHDSVLTRMIQQKLTDVYPDDHFVFEFEKMKPEQNFEIYPDEVITYFNPYEIAPYAVGQIRLAFSYAELADLIREDGPLAAMVE
ncbi:MAG: DUF3298 domain-containing protein [Bacteroidota bacterium]